MKSIVVSVCLAAIVGCVFLAPVLAVAYAGVVKVMSLLQGKDHA